MNEAPHTPAPPRLPETPFNGIVASVYKTEVPVGTGYPSTLFSLVIVGVDHASEQAPAVLHNFRVGTGIVPKSHLREGDRVRVTGVAWDQWKACVVATDVSFESSLLARRYLGGTGVVARPRHAAPAAQDPELPFNGIVISVDHSILKIGSYEAGPCVNLAIMSEADMSEHPLVVFHLVRTDGAVPANHLRPGHAVRVRQAKRVGNCIEATQIECDLTQFARRYHNGLPPE